MPDRGHVGEHVLGGSAGLLTLRNDRRTEPYTVSEYWVLRSEYI